MKPFTGVSGRLASLRVLLQRFTFAVLVAACFALMILARTDTTLVVRARLAVADAFAPILDVLSRPSIAIANLVGTVRDITTLRDENARLSRENAELLHWQTVANQLNRENQALRRQLNSVPDPEASFVTARVIGDTGGAFLRSVLVGAGAADGLRRGQPVIAEEALVGRVTDVGRRAARVLLLTDINAHVPAMLEGSGAKAVLSGDNSDQPRLEFLSAGAVAKPGQRVVTSGDGGVFPPGLPIGVVVGGQDGQLRVALFVRRADLDYVTIVDYGLPGVLPGDAGDGDSSGDP